MSSANENGFMNQKATGALYLCTSSNREALGGDDIMRKKGELVLLSISAGFSTSELMSTSAHALWYSSGLGCANLDRVIALNPLELKIKRYSGLI